MQYQVIHLEQNTPEWEEWRFTGIGASDAPIIMGENQFKSARELLHEKINRISPPQNSDMQRGFQLEPQAREAYSKKYGIKLTPLCVQSTGHHWLRASLDAISNARDHVVEIKCGTSAYKQAQRAVIPSYYYGQLQHQLQITGLPEIYYWCYLPDMPGIRIKVTRDVGYISRLLIAEEKFYAAMIGL